VAGPQEQEFTFSGAVGSLPFIYGANGRQTQEHMINWRWDNPRAFRDQVDRSNPQTTSSGKVTLTSERFSWYGSDDHRAKIELPICRQYKPGDFLSV